MYGVEEGEEEAGPESAAQELGYLELCSLQDDTGVLSIGSIDAPTPELLALDDITQGSAGSSPGFTDMGAEDPWARYLDTWNPVEHWAGTVERDTTSDDGATARTRSNRITPQCERHRYSKPSPRCRGASSGSVRCCKSSYSRAPARLTRPQCRTERHQNDPDGANASGQGSAAE